MFRSFRESVVSTPSFSSSLSAHSFKPFNAQHDQPVLCARRQSSGLLASLTGYSSSHEVTCRRSSLLLTALRQSGPLKQTAA